MSMVPHFNTCYVLCGIPGSGKSTWTNYWVKQTEQHTNNFVLSTDDIINDIASKHCVTYNDLFGDISYAFAERMTYKLAKFAFDPNKAYQNVYWDQTNLTVKTRARKLEVIPNDWYKVAVYFTIPDDLEERLASRPGKVIPPEVIAKMRESYVIPTYDEKFDFIMEGKLPIAGERV